MYAFHHTLKLILCRFYNQGMFRKASSSCKFHKFSAGKNFPGIKIRFRTEAAGKDFNMISSIPEKKSGPSLLTWLGIGIGTGLVVTVVAGIGYHYFESQRRLKDPRAEKVKELIEEEGNPGLKLRVFVTGGGCSGFQYGFTFDEEVNEDDATMEKNGVTLLIDPMSYQYLVGAEIDYSEGLEGSQFVIRNPNATSTCGCGSSFSA